MNLVVARISLREGAGRGIGKIFAERTKIFHVVVNLRDVMGSFHRRPHYKSLATMTILPATRLGELGAKLIAYISKLRARGGAVLCGAHGCLHLVILYVYYSRSYPGPTTAEH